ncbi:BnaC04g05750D [Brassica napus]|uniref:BnaC04g05750D protein n=1 Tax=Brassica napus TaxID=3708 RepID=A0A078G520_BRANA|nr:BnaC04g05750D [Brassica napus]
MSFVWLQSLKLWDLVEFWDQEAGLWMEIGTFSWAGGSLNLVTGSQYLQMAFNVFSLAAKYGTLGFRGDERSRYGSLDRGWIYESDDGMVTSLFVQPKNDREVDADWVLQELCIREMSCGLDIRILLFCGQMEIMIFFGGGEYNGGGFDDALLEVICREKVEVGSQVFSSPSSCSTENARALCRADGSMFVFELKFLPFGTYDSDDVFGEWTALDNSFCLEESRVSPPIDVYLVKTTIYQGDRKFLSEIRPQREIVKEDTEFERTALSFYLHECSMLEHITKFAVKTTLDFYSSFSKNNASPLCEWVDDPHGLVNCWIELRVPNSDSFLLFTVNGYDDGFHLIESFAFTSLRSVVNLTLLPSGSIRQTGDRVFLSEILPQSDKEVSDENMRCETVKEGVVSEIVKEDLGNADEIVSDREVSDENMRSEIVKKDLVKHANEIDEKMVSETVKEELVSEIVKEDLVKDSDEIDENRRSENVREDVKHADEITQAQHLDNVTKDLVKETADAQTDIEESVKECAEKATEAYLDRIRRQYIADQHKKRDELAEVVRKLTLETQQRDWEKQQKEKKEQRKLKTAQEKSKKDEQKKKKK